MPTSDKDVVQFAGFTGLRNTVDPSSMEPNDLVIARNVDVTDANRVTRRDGFGAPVVAGASHSLWSNGAQAFVVQGTSLLRINPDYSTDVLRADLTATAPMSFASLGNRVFYSNGHENGVVENGLSRPWGMPVPWLPAVSKIPGSLAVGAYQYVTTVSGHGGIESGALRAGTITLTEPGGLMFTDFGTFDSSVERINLYLSPPDGDMLYLVDSVPAAATAAAVTSPRDYVQPLATQHLSRPPAGQYILHAYGRMYVAVGPRVYYSEPAAPEHFDLRKNYPFESTVTMLGTANGGVIIGTETQAGWVSGTDPGKTEFEIRVPYGVIPGSLAYGPVDAAQPDAGLAAYFATTGGIVRVLPGGVFENLTRAKYTIPTADRGAGVVRTTQDGIAQYVAVLQG